MKKGFTIVELLVVIAIAGIIAAIMVGGMPSKNTSTSSTQISSENLPEPTNYAVDMAGVTTPEQLANLNTQLKAMDTEKHQFAVAIVKTTTPLDIDSYGIKLAEKWKVGKKGLDNGAIIIIATEDRKVRIEVGYGLEGEINDSKAGDIIRNDMSPLLKQAKWAEAVSAGLNSLNNLIK